MNSFFNKLNENLQRLMLKLRIEEPRKSAGAKSAKYGAGGQSHKRNIEENK